jgi:hypothetical protein
MGNDRGEIVTLALFALITLMMIVGSIALSVVVKCDPTVQRCLEHQQGPLQPGARFT